MKSPELGDPRSIPAPAISVGTPFVAVKLSFVRATRRITDGMSRQRGWPSTKWPATTRQIRNFSSGRGWPQPDPGKWAYPDVLAGYLSTEVLAAGTPANEPRGLVTAADGTVKLGAVESGWCDERRLEKRAPAEKAVTNVVIASLVLCMILILLSAAGSQTPQKAIAKRPRH